MATVVPVCVNRRGASTWLCGIAEGRREGAITSQGEGAHAKEKCITRSGSGTFSGGAISYLVTSGSEQVFIDDVSIHSPPPPPAA